MYLDVDAAYQWTGRIAGVGLAIGSLEEISLRRAYATGGVYDLRYIDTALRRTENTDVPTRLQTRSGLSLAWMVSRLIAALWLLLGPNGMVHLAIPWTVIALTTLVIQSTHRLGGEDGSDQMNLILAISFSLALVFGSWPGVREAGLYFIGAQSVLAYTTAGVAKLLCLEWRNGTAVSGVLSTRSHGVRWAAMVVQQSPVLQHALCWSTIIYETGFVTALFLPLPLLVALLVLGILFHASIAVVMGLNGFFWAFVATYPSVVFLNEAVRGFF
jgi:hypothetical protein